MSEDDGSHFKLLKTSHIVSTQDCITIDNAFRKEDKLTFHTQILERRFDSKSLA